MGKLSSSSSSRSSKGKTSSSNRGSSWNSGSSSSNRGSGSGTIRGVGSSSSSSSNSNRGSSWNSGSSSSSSSSNRGSSSSSSSSSSNRGSSSGGTITGVGGSNNKTISTWQPKSNTNSSSILNKPSNTNNGYTVKSGVLGANTNTANKTTKRPGRPDMSTEKNTNGNNKIPRYNNPNFKQISTPNNRLIKSYNGGKMVDGVIRYPTTAVIDPAKAARNQAFVDVSYGLRPVANNAMGDIYGEDYYNEVDRLNSLPFGAPAWGWPGEKGGGKKNVRESHVSSDVLGAYTDTPNPMGGYEDALRAAQEASADALRQQIEQGVQGIYGQKDPLKQQYEQSAQQAYIAQMQGKKALPQQMSAQGLTGGATESANVALETSYGNGLNDLTNTYNQSLAQVDKDAANYRATGDINLAQNAAQYQDKMAAAAIQAQQQAEQIRAQKELAAYNAQLDANRQQNEWNWQQQQNQAGWTHDQEMKKLQAQLDYDYWLKEQGYKANNDSGKSGRSAIINGDDGNGNNEIDFGAESDPNSMNALEALQKFSGKMKNVANNVASSYKNFFNQSNSLDNTPSTYQDIVNSQSLSDYEKKRRLNANGYQYL